jgi:hypothetical protein
MLEQIRKLIEDSTVRAKLEAVSSAAEATALLIRAGIEKGYQFTTDGVSRFVTQSTSGSGSVELSEEDLLCVAGGLPLDTIPTASHDHMSCCTECPPGSTAC